MKKGIILTFPGSTGTEIPLLYYCAKYYEDQGYDKVFVSQPQGGETDFEAAYAHAAKVLEGIDFSEYEHIILAGKSRGTVVACMVKEKYRLPASLILLTPIDATLPYMTEDNDILLVATGSRDRHLSSDVLKEVCIQRKIPCHIEEGVGHRMEVREDLDRNLGVIRHVVGKLP